MSTPVNYEEDVSGFFKNELSLNLSKTELIPLENGGGMCVLHKFLYNQKWLVVKRLKPEFKDNPLYQNALNKEFEISYSLDHPSIVKYLQRGTDAEGLFLIMEFIDGLDLRSYFKNSHLATNKAKSIKLIGQILEGLNYLHSRQVYHLDLKPENILITTKGENVKLIDFGLASTDAHKAIASGTYKYASPEQIDSPKKTDGRSDLYSFANVILELYTGSINQEKISELPFFLKAIIRNCLKEKQEDRFESASMALQYFKKIQNIGKNILVIGAVLLIVVTFTVIYNYKSKNDVSSNNNAVSSGSQNIGLNDSIQNINNQNTRLDGSLSADSLKKIVNKASEPFLKIENITKRDSMKAVELGHNIYASFIKKLKAIENSYNGNKKIYMIKLKDTCIKVAEKNWIDLKNKKSTSALTEQRLFNIYNAASTQSEKRMDSLIFGKGK